MRTSVAAFACLLAARSAGTAVDAFTLLPASSSLAPSRLPYSSAGPLAPALASVPRTMDAGDQEVIIKRVETDEEVMEVASYRNNLESPQMLIDKQQSKRDAIDKQAEAIKGVAIGLALGTAVGIVDYVSSKDVGEALTRFGLVGGIVGAFLGVNNGMGNSVYVMDLAEANNRLKVDYAEGLMARQDVGFVAKVDDLDLYGSRYRGSGGVVGCVDCQLRNCDESRNKMTYGELPPHVHIRNVDVDRGMQRRGIARELVKEVEEYAGTTPAQMITLVVDNTNLAAINLYKEFGYDMEDIGSPLAQPKYGVWTAGRSIMTKYI